MTKTDVQAGCFLSIIGVALLACCFGGCYGLSKVQTSDGYRDGTIQKVSETGVFWKTWEVETLGGGMWASNAEGRGTLSPETFQYTAPADLIDQLRAVPPGRKVRVHYRKQMAAWKPNGESAYFVVGVEVLP